MELLIPVKGICWEEAEEDAEAILTEFQPAALQSPIEVNIEKIFEYEIEDYMKREFGLSFEVGYRDLSYLGIGVKGHTDATNGYCFIDAKLSDSKSSSPDHRYFRSTLGHEIYHCIKHVPQFGGFISSYRSATGSLYRMKTDTPIFKNPDIQADTFSGALLMPRRTLIPLLNRGVGVNNLANIYNVNPAFVRSRLRCNTIKKTEAVSQTS